MGEGRGVRRNRGFGGKGGEGGFHLSFSMILEKKNKEYRVVLLYLFAFIRNLQQY